MEIRNTFISFGCPFHARQANFPDALPDFGIWREPFGDRVRQRLAAGLFQYNPGLLCFCLRGLFADGLVEFAGGLIQLILHRLEQLHFRQIGNCLALLIATAAGAARRITIVFGRCSIFIFRHRRENLPQMFHAIPAAC